MRNDSQKNLKAYSEKLRQFLATKSLASSGLILIVTTTLVLLFSTVKDMLVAAKFGISKDLDVFYIAFLLPGCVISLFTSAASSSLVPTYIKVREQQGVEPARQFFASCMVLALLVLFICSLVIGVAFPCILPIIASEYSAPKLLLAQKLFYIFLPSIIFSGITVMWTAVMNARERFVIAALASAAMPVSTIFCLLILYSVLGIASVAFGYVVGVILQCVILAFCLKKFDVGIIPKWHGVDDNIKNAIKMFLPLVCSSLISTSITFADQAMAVTLGAGSISTINYALKIMAMIVQAILVPLGVVLLPHFSILVAKEDWVGVKASFRSICNKMMLISIPSTIILYFISEFLVKLIFQRGMFNATYTKMVAEVLALFVLQLPFHLVGILMLRIISSMGMNTTIMKLSIVNTVINVVCNYVLMKMMGVKGIALSTTIVYITSSIMLGYVILNSRLYSENDKVESLEASTAVESE